MNGKIFYSCLKFFLLKARQIVSSIIKLRRKRKREWKRGEGGVKIEKAREELLKWLVQRIGEKEWSKESSKRLVQEERDESET